nr:hypothetical protein [Delftia sp. PE138]
MDEKLLFIADHLRSGVPLSELCRRYGISRKTAYKWVERYRQLGMDGLQERSRRPHGNNQAISYRRACALVNRQRAARGAPRVNAKRVYRVMAQAALLLPKAPRRR